MNEERSSPIERMLERTVRAVAGGQLHPAEILERVQTAVAANVRDRVAPNQVEIAFEQGDYERYVPALPDLREEIAWLLDGFERREGLSRIGERLISFVAGESVAPGLPQVATAFVDTRHRDLPTARGETRRISRHRNAVIVLGDGSRVRLTHTPFSIGRGPGNDLVIPSLAVSRRHALITHGVDGFEITDLGSHNGIVAEGERQQRVVLWPGREVVLGDTALRLEEMA